MEAGGMEISEGARTSTAAPTSGSTISTLMPRGCATSAAAPATGRGWSSALDSYDFAPKPYVPLSGLADRQSTSTPARRRRRSSTSPPRSEAPDLPFRQAAYRFKRFQFRWSPPTRFAEKYAAEMAASQRIRALAERQPRRPAARRRARDRRPGRCSAATTPTTPASPSGPAPTHSAPAASRTRGCCSISPARSRRASATAPAWSAAASATTRTSSSPTPAPGAGAADRVLLPARDLHARAGDAELRHAMQPGWIEKHRALALWRCAPQTPEEFAILLGQQVQRPDTDRRSSGRCCPRPARRACCAWRRSRRRTPTAG